MGDKNNENNPFCWYNMRLKLPLGKYYVPSEPWVNKVRKGGNVEIKVFIYLDDVRLLGWCNRRCWNSTRFFDYKCNYIGIQDAPRKIKRPDQIQGTWLDSTLH